MSRWRSTSPPISPATNPTRSSARRSISGCWRTSTHLYRYSELLDYLLGKDPNTIVQGKTEIFPGRPTSEHHNDPEVRLLRHYEKNRALPLSRIHTLTLLCGEQQTYNLYKEHGPEYGNRRARELYAEIGEVEEEHVTFYESLLDPTETLLQRQVQHQLMEVYN